MKSTIQIRASREKGPAGIMIGRDRVWCTTASFIRSFDSEPRAAAWLKKLKYAPQTEFATRDMENTPFDMEYFREKQRE